MQSWRSLGAIKLLSHEYTLTKSTPMSRSTLAEWGSIRRHSCKECEVLRGGEDTLKSEVSWRRAVYYSCLGTLGRRQFIEQNNPWAVTLHHQFAPKLRSTGPTSAQSHLRGRPAHFSASDQRTNIIGRNHPVSLAPFVGRLFTFGSALHDTSYLRHSCARIITPKMIQRILSICYSDESTLPYWEDARAK